MARKRASMREGPLAELFRATEAAQRAQGEPDTDAPPPPSAAEPSAPEAQTAPPATGQQPPLGSEPTSISRVETELEATVDYEGDAYARIEVRLESGDTAFVYVGPDA